MDPNYSIIKGLQCNLLVLLHISRYYFIYLSSNFTPWYNISKEQTQKKTSTQAQHLPGNNIVSDKRTHVLTSSLNQNLSCWYS